MLVLLVFVLLLNSIVIFLRKKNNIIIFLTFIYIVLLMGGNTFTTDYPYYRNYYDSNIFHSSMEWGFVTIALFFKKIGASYQLFLFLYELIGIIILSICGIKCKVNFHVLFLLYSLTAIFMDTNEIRQFMAYMLYTYALILLSEKKIFLFYFICLLGILFHVSSAILLMLPIFICIHERKYVIFLLFYLILCFCILTFLNGNKIIGIEYLINIFFDSSKFVYFMNSTRFGFLKCFFGNFSNLFIAYCCLQFIQKNENVFTQFDLYYAKTVVYSILYLSVAMPLCQLDTEFIRFFRFSVCPVIILLGIVMRNNYKRKSYRTLLAFSFFICYEIAFQHYRVMFEVLNNNLIN